MHATKSPESIYSNDSVAAAFQYPAKSNRFRELKLSTDAEWPAAVWSPIPGCTPPGESSARPSVFSPHRAGAAGSLREAAEGMQRRVVRRGKRR